MEVSVSCPQVKYRDIDRFCGAGSVFVLYYLQIARRDTPFTLGLHAAHLQAGQVTLSDRRDTIGGCSIE